MHVAAHHFQEKMNMQKNTIQHVILIANCLKQAESGWLWPTEIAKRTNIHRKTVTRLIETHLANFVQEQRLEPSNIRMFKLKPNADMTSILKFLSVKEKISRAVAGRK